MPKYTFSVNAIVSLTVDVEASNVDEAIQLAKEAPAQSLCHQCSRGEEGDWNLGGEIDCDPSYCELTDVLVDGDYPKISFDTFRKKWNS